MDTESLFSLIYSNCKLDALAATTELLRWVAFVTADILPPPQKFLLLPQVPIIMVVSPSQIVFAWVARLCRFGPKREITPRNTHFRAYFKD